MKPPRNCRPPTKCSAANGIRAFGELTGKHRVLTRMNRSILEQADGGARGEAAVELATNRARAQQTSDLSRRQRGDLCLDVDMIAGAGDALSATSTPRFADASRRDLCAVVQPPPRLWSWGLSIIAQRGPHRRP